jgi:hypothetical protein
VNSLKEKIGSLRGIVMEVFYSGMPLNWNEIVELSLLSLLFLNIPTENCSY